MASYLFKDPGGALGPFHLPILTAFFHGGGIVMMELHLSFRCTEFCVTTAKTLSRFGPVLLLECWSYALGSFGKSCCMRCNHRRQSRCPAWA